MRGAHRLSPREKPGDPYNLHDPEASVGLDGRTTRINFTRYRGSKIVLCAKDDSRRPKPMPRRSTTENNISHLCIPRMR